MDTNRFIQAEFSLSTYEARRDAKQAHYEAERAATIQKMIDNGFTEEEINAVLF